MPRLRSNSLRIPPSLVRYGIALLVSLLALLLTRLFLPFMQSNLFLWFFPAIVFSAWYGGLGPSLFAIAFASVTVGYFFLSPFDSLGIGLGGILRLGVFGLIALMISSLTAVRRSTAATAEQQREQLRITL